MPGSGGKPLQWVICLGIDNWAPKERSKQIIWHILTPALSEPSLRVRESRRQAFVPDGGHRFLLVLSYLILRRNPSALDRSSAEDVCLCDCWSRCQGCTLKSHTPMHISCFSMCSTQPVAIAIKSTGLDGSPSRDTKCEMLFHICHQWDDVHGIAIYLWSKHNCGINSAPSIWC